MSQTSTHPALKWILIVIAVVTALGAVFVVLFSTRPMDEYHVARELEKRGFEIKYILFDNDKIWKLPYQVHGDGLVITPDDCRLFCQLPRLDYLRLESCDVSDLNLDEIGNCREFRSFALMNGTGFPVSELKKLTVCPVEYIHVDSKDVDLNDSDLEVFIKYTHLKGIDLRFNSTGVTDACLEYFEKIPTLKLLVLLGTSITPEGVEEFKKKRPDVKFHVE